jgi:formate hydrogenlyase transcriptional activator
MPEFSLVVCAAWGQGIFPQAWLSKHRVNGAIKDVWAVLKRQVVAHLLDEIGDLPREIQIALLRVLQEREIERVGGKNSIPVDVRVLAATHHDLSALVDEGRFRDDLLYRLNAVPIEVPPLRERVADIPLLVEYFIDRFGKRAGKKFKTIDKKFLKAFQSYVWPGNVHELQNVIERAVILSEGETVAMDESWLKRELRANPRRTGTLHGTL